MEGDEHIYDEPRSHAKYMGTVHLYIPDIFGYSNTGCPGMGFSSKIELVLLLSISCVDVFYLYMFCCSVCDTTR